MSGSRTMQTRRVRYGRLALGCAVLAAGCGAGEPTTRAPAESGGQQGATTMVADASTRGLATRYDVRYTEQTTVLDRETLASALISESADRSEYRFSARSAAARALEPGTVIILAGKGIRKVVRVREESGELIVLTGPATLNEAIRDGTIAWEYRIDWENLPQESYQTAMVAPSVGPSRASLLASFAPRLFATTAAGAPSPLALNIKVQGFDVAYKLEPRPDRINMELTASRSAGGTKYIALKATGWISNFTQESLLTYENSTPTQFTLKTNGLESEMELTWAAFSLGQQAVTQSYSLNIPLELKIPFTVGALPFVLTLKSVLQVVPHLLPPDASSGGSYKVHYRWSRLARRSHRGSPCRRRKPAAGKINSTAHGTLRSSTLIPSEPGPVQPPEAGLHRDAP
jgi:hypothetical protein